jgi:hypothetical protein
MRAVAFVRRVSPDTAHAETFHMNSRTPRSDFNERRRVPALRCGHALAALALLIVCTTAQAQTEAHGTGAQAAVDIPALLREVARSERAMTPRRLEYTWTMKVTNRDVNKRGEVTKEEVKVYESYPVRGELVTKLVSENGVAVSPEKADEQLKKAIANLEKAAREEEKRKTNAPQTPPTPVDPNVIPTFGFQHRFGFRSGLSRGAYAFALWRFFRACEFYAPRRESVRGRDAIVLDFRPRADFQPTDDLQKPYTKLSGRVWIDLADKAVVRLEAWPATDVAGAANSSPPPAPAIVYEETRLPEGIWMESLVRINTNINRPVFNGVDVDVTTEMSDFKRFQTNTNDAQVAPPTRPQL